jgi:hypothetical protein
MPRQFDPMRTAVSQLLATPRAPSSEGSPRPAVLELRPHEAPRDGPDTVALYLGLDVQYLDEDALATYFGDLPSDPAAAI